MRHLIRTDNMRILIVGSGGREHALAWKLAQSPEVEQIFIAPGNGGTGQCGTNVNIRPDDIVGLVEFAKKENVDLAVPGPELPLTLGICDAMQEAGIQCFGPDKYCAQLEGSKIFAKNLMEEAGIPTARSRNFNSAEEALKYIDEGPEEIVIKADGLAAGKGVIVASSKEEAARAVEDILQKRQFGDAGANIIIEERLYGEEASLLCLCDGETAVPLPSAQDHKAAHDHDKGPNTGGMGAYSPAPVLPDDKIEEMTDLVIRPVLKALAKAGHPFKGVMYAGLMITSKGPKVLEYNVRFGDPECQPLMMRLDSDLASHMKAACEGRLNRERITFKPGTALGVVLAAEGYPGAYDKGMPITGVEDAEQNKQVKVFHGGTRPESDSSDNGAFISDGGRVLCITAIEPTLPRAQAAAYEALEKIKMPGSRYRKDIGFRGILRMVSENA